MRLRRTLRVKQSVGTTKHLARTAAIAAAAVICCAPTLAGNATACTPSSAMKGNYDRACRKMRVHTPGRSFPLNLHDQIRLSTARDGFAMMADDEFSGPAPSVYRREGHRWVEVEFELEGSGTSRTLKLDDPTPGTYSVVWKHETCAPTTESGRFTITPKVSWPDAIGTLKVTRSAVVDERVRRGTGAACEPIWANEVAHEVDLELTLAPALRPWAESIDVAVEVDGKIVVGYSGIHPDDLEEGVARRELRQICSNDDGGKFRRKLRNGDHEVRLLTRVADQAPVRSEPVEITIACP